MIDYYSLLGVSPTAEFEVIEGAYKALMKKYHLDKWQGDRCEAEEKAKQLNAAYEVLKDPDQRRAYDFKKASSSEGVASNRDESTRSAGAPSAATMSDSAKNEVESLPSQHAVGFSTKLGITAAAAGMVWFIFSASSMPTAQSQTSTQEVSSGVNVQELKDSWQYGSSKDDFEGINYSYARQWYPAEQGNYIFTSFDCEHKPGASGYATLTLTIGHAGEDGESSEKESQRQPVKAVRVKFDEGEPFQLNTIIQDKSLMAYAFDLGISHLNKAANFSMRVTVGSMYSNNEQYYDVVGNLKNEAISHVFSDCRRYLGSPS